MWETFTGYFQESRTCHVGIVDQMKTTLSHEEWSCITGFQWIKHPISLWNLIPSTQTHTRTHKHTQLPSWHTFDLKVWLVKWHHFLLATWQALHHLREQWGENNDNNYTFMCNDQSLRATIYNSWGLELSGCCRVTEHSVLTKHTCELELVTHSCLVITSWRGRSYLNVFIFITALKSLQ